VSAVGRTPLVRLNKVSTGNNSLVLAKIEGRNPAYSVKDRIAVYMIQDAEKKGFLKPGMEIVEPTSGNTGIGLAYVSAIKGYALTLTMPESMSVERRKVLKMFGANLILTPGSEGMKGAIERATQMFESEPGKYYMPQQFENPANPLAHEETTGPEIWQDTGGLVDVLVCGVGTGGTITGISRFIKKKMGKKVHVVAVEPSESPVLSQALGGGQSTPSPHKIQGIGAGFVPSILDMSLLDEVVQVSSEDAISFARLLAQKEGLLSGISSGAAAFACNQIASRKEFKGNTIVTVFPSAGERYLSSALFDGITT